LEVFKKFLNVFCFKELLRTPDSELRTGILTRRLFLRGLIGLPLLSSLSFPLREGEAASTSFTIGDGKNSIANFFLGEELVYEVGVWLFKRVALGKLSFKEAGEKGRYVAILQAETLGVLGWVARYRVDTYRSTMEEVEGGRRLRSISFEEDVKIGNKVRKKIHLFDYRNRKWVQMRQRKDGSMERTVQEIPSGMVYDDFITASYNFRYGVYGEVDRGKKYSVATFPRKKATTYEVIIAGKEEEEERRKRSEKSKEGKEHYVKLFLDPEITHSKEGLIEGWLSKDLYPVEGTIKEVILFGDVKGTLIKNTKG
jgi:hypothetical protein